MKKTFHQFISLGVMLVLIAFVISLLPESTVKMRSEQSQSTTDIAASELNRDNARNN